MLLGLSHQPSRFNRKCCYSSANLCECRVNPLMNTVDRLTCVQSQHPGYISEADKTSHQVCRGTVHHACTKIENFAYVQQINFPRFPQSSVSVCDLTRQGAALLLAAVAAIVGSVTRHGEPSGHRQTKQRRGLKLSKVFYHGLEEV